MIASRCTPNVYETQALGARERTHDRILWAQAVVTMVGILNYDASELGVGGLMLAQVRTSTQSRNVVRYLYGPCLPRRAALSLPMVPSVGILRSW